MATLWVLQDRGEEIGPMSFDELAKRVSDRRVLEDFLVRPHHSATWQRADSVFGLFYLARHRLAAKAETVRLPLANSPLALKEGTSEKPKRGWLWLKEHDQAFIAVVLMVFLSLVAVNWIRLSGWGNVPLEIDRQVARWYDFTIDINDASWVEWAQIEGIGETTARKIVEERQENGPFRGVADLQRVNGIGQKSLDRIRPFLVGGLETEAVATKKPPTGED